MRLAISKNNRDYDAICDNRTSLVIITKQHTFFGAKGDMCQFPRLSCVVYQCLQALSKPRLFLAKKDAAFINPPTIMSKYSS